MDWLTNSSRDCDETAGHIMDTLSILCATDNNYAPYCGIMLTSLFESNKDCRFNVFVFVKGDISEINRSKLDILGRKTGNCISMIPIDDSMVEALPVSIRHITVPTYYRLVAAELLPIDLDRIIYLDCDIIVLGSIKQLWEVNLSGKALAGIENCPEKSVSHCERLGYPDLFGYFNAGVLIINLQYWREHNVGQELMEYAWGHLPVLYYMDQDILNRVLFDARVTLPERFNLQISCFWTVRWQSFSEEFHKRFASECERVRIVHYVGPEKPWSFKAYGGPFFSQWEKYRRKSLWRKECKPLPYSKFLLFLIKRRFFPVLFGKQHSRWVISEETVKYFK